MWQASPDKVERPGALASLVLCDKQGTQQFGVQVLNFIDKEPERAALLLEGGTQVLNQLGKVHLDVARVRATARYFHTEVYPSCSELDVEGSNRTQGGFHTIAQSSTRTQSPGLSSDLAGQDATNARGPCAVRAGLKADREPPSHL